MKDLTLEQQHTNVLQMCCNLRNGGKFILIVQIICSLTYMNSITIERVLIDRVLIDKQVVNVIVVVGGSALLSKCFNIFSQFSGFLRFSLSYLPPACLLIDRVLTDKQV